MDDLKAAIWIELRKATRSRMPLFTTLGFMMLPLAMAVLMFIYKDPEFARSSGLIGAKANLAGGSADWPFFLSMYAQGIAIAGIMLFSLVVSWVFGREFADGTLKDLLAVPVARGALLAAKFIVAGLWSLALMLATFSLGLLLGALIGLPQGSPTLFLQGSGAVFVTAGLVIVAITPIAFFASVGRGYLLPMGMAILILILANLIAVLGWGDYFPWSVPALYAGLASQGGGVEPPGYWIVALTGLAGILATHAWWKYADQSR